MFPYSNVMIDFWYKVKIWCVTKATNGCRYVFLLCIKKCLQQVGNWMRFSKQINIKNCNRIKFQPVQWHFSGIFFFNFKIKLTADTIELDYSMCRFSVDTYYVFVSDIEFSFDVVLSRIWPICFREHGFWATSTQQKCM